MKIAIVHDWLTSMGGADRVVRILHDIFPDAPIFTLVYNPSTMPPAFAEMDIRTSFLQRLPLSRSHHRIYLPLFPLAVEQFDLSGFDAVISSSHCCAHGAITGAESFHLCYCYTPVRYAWDLYHTYMRSAGRLRRLAAAPVLSYLRQWDYAAARRVDAFVAISNAVRRRIEKHYGRTATVLHPPADIGFYRPAPPGERGSYFFLMARHVPYKRTDLAVRAFNTLGLPLYVAGGGPESRRLRAMARPNVRFFGPIDNVGARYMMARCKAFILPQEEDFGITSVEAQACGRPVIAYGRGGALDSVVDGVTGTFFHEQTPEALAEAVRSFRPDDFSPEAARANAERFGIPAFKRDFRQLVDSALAAHRAGGPPQADSPPRPT